ncbi:hypothetical protein PTI98_000487 [Pleurotus ostreatus]|nr:hypothetical protein PTI98_000487 [Pleurotus ostreatus]
MILDGASLPSTAPKSCTPQSSMAAADDLRVLMSIFYEIRTPKARRIQDVGKRTTGLVIVSDAICLSSTYNQSLGKEFGHFADALMSIWARRVCALLASHTPAQYLPGFRN